MSKTIIPQKQARHTFQLDPWSRFYCFTCHLDDCVGPGRIQCPIVQAKKNKRTPPAAAPAFPSHFLGEGQGVRV